MSESRYPSGATGLNTGCTSDVQVSAKHNTQIPGPAIYTDTWTCHLHRESRLTPHTDITPPHRSRPLSKPPTHSPPTPPQPKHRHMSNRGLVKPKPNSLIHSPPIPPRAKHIHMSHTPPTPHKHVTCTRQNT